MFNLLIVCNDFKSVKRLTNDILNKMDVMKIIGIVSNLDELNSFIMQNEPDIILLSNSIYSKLVKLNILKQDKMYIILSNLNQIDYKKCSNKLYISNSISNNHFQDILRSFLLERDYQQLKNAITEIFTDIRFNFSLFGTKYLIEAIIYSYVNKDLYVLENLESKVYPHIANKYHTTIKNVKWSIVRAINNMYFNHTTYTMKKISKYFYLDLLKKPTAKIIICTVVNNLEHHPLKDFNKNESELYDNYKNLYLF